MFKTAVNPAERLAACRHRVAETQGTLGQSRAVVRAAGQRIRDLEARDDWAAAAIERERLPALARQVAEDEKKAAAAEAEMEGALVEARAAALKAYEPLARAAVEALERLLERDRALRDFEGPLQAGDRLSALRGATDLDGLARGWRKRLEVLGTE